MKKILLAIFLLISGYLSAATITVSTATETALKTAISTAGAGDIVDITTTGTILLTSTIQVDKAITIQCSNASGIIISGDNTYRVFEVSPETGTATLRNLNITAGKGDGNSGGVYCYTANNGKLVIENCAIYNCTTTGSNAFGGGIGINCDADITNCTLSGNTAEDGGGAISIYDTWPIVNINHCTIYNNTSTDALNAGGLDVYINTQTTISNSIIANNNAGAGLKNFNVDLGGILISGGYNLSNLTIDSNVSNSTDLENKNLATEIKVLALANNGGKTLTHAISFGSLAINGAKTSTLTKDQIGSNRFGSADIGAYELPLPEINLKGNGTTIVNGDATPSLADYSDFGSIAIAGGVVNRTFKIENSGYGDLILSGNPIVAISGTNAADFTVTTQPNSPIASNSLSDFTIVFNPSAEGLRTATVSIANSDLDENPYNFTIQGTGTKTTPTITWANPADISYGEVLTLTQLNATASVAGTFSYTPAIGTKLNAGTAQTLKVDFTPTDAVSYATTSKTVTINVAKAPLNIKADNKSKTYGAANPTLTVTYSGFVSGDNAASLTTAPTISTTATATSGVNSYPITASGAVSNNYSFTYTPGTLTVNKAPLTIKADNKSKIYGDANPTLTVTYTGFAGTDNAASLTTQPTVSTTATAASGVNSYPITASGAASNNYSFTYTAGTLTVNQAPLIVTTSSFSRLYGALDMPYPISYSGFKNGDTQFSLSLPPAEMAMNMNASTPVGNYPNQIVPTMLTNYSVVIVAGNITIDPAPLTITADNKTKVVGQDNPTFTVSYSGFKNGETSAVLTTQPTFSCAAVKASPVGDYPITVGGAVASNYSISYVAGKLTVSTVTDIADTEVSIVEITPNPSTGIFTIQGADDSLISNITVRDMAGKLIAISNEKTIDLTAQENGIYIVSFTVDNQPMVFRVVKR